MSANFDNILSAARSSAEKRIILLPHTIRKMVGLKDRSRQPTFARSFSNAKLSKIIPKTNAAIVAGFLVLTRLDGRYILFVSQKQSILQLSRRTCRMRMNGQMAFDRGYKNLECMNCKGRMKPGFAPFHIDRKGYHLVFDRVPELVCGQCREVYFDEPQVDSIQNAIKAVDAQTELIAV